LTQKSGWEKGRRGRYEGVRVPVGIDVNYCRDIEKGGSKTEDSRRVDQCRGKHHKVALEEEERKG